MAAISKSTFVAALAALWAAPRLLAQTSVPSDSAIASILQESVSGENGRLAVLVESKHLVMLRTRPIHAG